MSAAVANNPSILFHDDIHNKTRLFQQPESLIIAEHEHEFEQAFIALQTAHQSGKWLAGYLSYEAGYLLEPKLRPLLPEQRRVPLLCFGVFDQPETSSQAANLKSGNAALLHPHASWSADEYHLRFGKLHQHLRQGDCYQGNLTFPIEAKLAGDPEAFFWHLAGQQPVRYSALVNLPGPKILSRSPELFFSVDQQGWIETHPMKGTSPRGKTQEEDDYYRDFLSSDPKSQAENRMIVDLLRNDISLISEVGSLDVPVLFHVERYPTLHQMISHVRAKLKPNLTLRDIFAALFPCGSITGAPKISAMTILNQIEQRPRDIYCGSIGWVAPNGEMRFNVAIRTITLFDNQQAVFNVGGGVIYDSTAESEYAECLLKARYAVNPADISGT